MRLGARGQLFLVSLGLMGVVGATSGIFLERALRSEWLAQPGIDSARLAEKMRTLHGALFEAALVGFVVAVALSALAAQLLTRQLRVLVKKARRVSKGKEERIELAASGELGKLAGSFNRISDDLHKTAEKLGRERARLHTMLEAMDEAVLALDEAGRVRMANPAALRVLGLSEAPAVRPLRELVTVAPLVALGEASVSGAATTIELDLPRVPPRRVLARATPLEGIGGAVIVMHDVTEVRRLETMRRDFVANVSHELRTPVSVIGANAETLLGGGLDDAERAVGFVEAILRNAERLARIISDLLDLSRIEAGKYSIQLEAIPIVEALADAVAEVGVHAAERNIAIRIEATGELSAMADGAALEHVLLNLLDNAVKYTPLAGHVIVRAVATTKSVRIEVEDDGPGIAPEHRARVFERFYRVDRGRSRDTGGTGLGLAIVKHLAEQMGGTVSVGSAAKHGSVFCVELPRAATEDPAS